MAVRICHASIAENGRITGGASGDQTGREVCTRDWYPKNWNVVLRCTDPIIRKQVIIIAKKLADSNLVGYDQGGRNSLYAELKKCGWNVDKYIKSGVKTETDCSAFMYVCYCCVIASMRKDGNAPTTSTMRSFYKQHGFEVLTDKKYLTSSDYLLAGDVLVHEGHHTVMAITDGPKATSTTTNKTTTNKSTATNNKTGNPYKEPSKNITSKVNANIHKLQSYISKGEGVMWVQWHLKKWGADLGVYGVDGDCGQTTVSAIIAFQKAMKIEQDGIVGQTTRKYLKKYE